MYTEFICDQLCFAHDKGMLESENLIEVGHNSWQTSLNRFMKSRLPGFILSNSTTEMLSRLKVGQYTNYPSDKDIPEGTKAKVVCAFEYLHGRMDPIKSWQLLHGMTELNGYMIINGPMGISSALSPMSVNQLIHIANANNYAVPYFVVADRARQFVQRVNSQSTFTNDNIKELLYKFKETPELRVGVIFKKTQDEAFKY